MELLVARKPGSAKTNKRAGLKEPTGGGVDLSLIRWMLSLTPAERLRAGQDFANSVMRLRVRRAKA